MTPVDRLGDALREIARGMAEHATTAPVRVTVVSGRIEATYELKLVGVRTRRKPAGQGRRP